MKALTVWQPWASLIVHGLKAVEFRSWALPARMVGQRIVIHAGKPDPRKALKHLLVSDDHILGSCGPSCRIGKVRAALERCASNPSLMPRGAGLGTVILGEPERADLFYHRQGLAIGGEGPWNIAWPVLRPIMWGSPVACQGAQGFWPWSLPVDVVDEEDAA